MVLWRLSWISKQNDYSYVCSASHPDNSYQVSNQLAYQEKKFKIDFHNSRPGDHLGFPIEIILTSFDQKVTLTPRTKFRVNWHFGSGEEIQDRHCSWC